MEVAVLGAGAWGTGFAVATGRRHRVRLWARDERLVGEIRSNRENRRYLPGVPVPVSVTVSGEIGQVLSGAAVVVSAVPAAAMADLLDSIPQALRGTPLMWLSKGFVEAPDGAPGACLPHQVVERLWPGPRAVLSGPSFAIEVARGLPAAVTVAAAELAAAQRFADWFRLESFRTYATDDLVGVEVGGAVKNVLAIAAGISDGLGFGANARAALVTRGLAETGRLLAALGGRRETLMGLSGLGDLVLTCTGDLSRNRTVGLELARGRPLDSVLGDLGHVAEGVATAARVRGLVAALDVDMPICAAVYDVLFAGKTPREAVEDLLRREPRIEGI